MPTETARRHAVLVPVKPPARGKSRLVGVDDRARAELASAFALDTVTACLAAEGVAEVLVATDDAVFASAMGRLGATCIPDGAGADLNAALRQAAADARRRWPHLTPVALCADLPALRSDDLDAALEAAARLPADGAAFVADADGVGTTLYLASYDVFEPRYGDGSAAAHAGAGVRALEGGLVSLRRDVDDLVDLAAAVGLGVGPRTQQVLDGIGLFRT